MEFLEGNIVFKFSLGYFDSGHRIYQLHSMKIRLKQAII